MWKLVVHDEFGKRRKRFQKKHRQELLNVEDNLDTYLQALQLGAKPQQIHRGFIHTEPRGVIALDQKGKGKHLKETRLYVYPDEPATELHVITIGDKQSQKNDITLCTEFVEQLLQERIDEQEQKSTAEREDDAQRTEEGHGDSEGIPNSR